jgi:hypothetical protein
MALKKRNVVLAAAATTLGIGGMLLPGAVANAATADQNTAVTTQASQTVYERNGYCDSGEFCLYFNQDYGDALFDLYYADADFSNDTFSSNHSLAVDNNTRSFWNHDDYTWRVYSEANYRGYQVACINPGEYGNLSSSDYDLASSARPTTARC